MMAEAPGAPSAANRERGQERGRSRSLRIRYAAGSCAGRKGDGSEKINQDTYVTQLRVAGRPHVHMFAVFDGHGPVGHLVSSFAKTRVPELVADLVRDMDSNCALLTCDHPLDAVDRTGEMRVTAKGLSRVFNQVQAELGLRGIEASLSGTTAVVVLFFGQHAVVANVGDSRCVLGRSEGPDHTAALALTVDQKPDLATELARIRACGGFVQPILSETGTFVGPARVWSTNTVRHLPGLAMSRSIGDGVATEAGVICDPVVTYHFVRPGLDTHIVIASDGVWEFLTEGDVISRCTAHKDCTGAVIDVCRAAQQSWVDAMAGTPSLVIDDITAVVIQVNSPARASRSVESPLAQPTAPLESSPDAETPAHVSPPSPSGDHAPPIANDASSANMDAERYSASQAASDAPSSSGRRPTVRLGGALRQLRHRLSRRNRTAPSSTTASRSLYDHDGELMRRSHS